MARPTLIDVGIEANVSAITVSRAIRQPDKVSKAVRERVEAAIKKLGYVPNVAASNLASRKSNIIGMIVPSIESNVFADVIAGAYEAIADSNMTLQIVNVNHSSLKEEEILPTLLNLNPAGLIVAGVDQTEQSYQLLKAAECPVVQVMDFDKEPVDMMIGFNHQTAASLAVTHLVDRGYRRIGFLGAQIGSRSQKRIEGYREVLERHGLYDPQLQITTRSRPSVAVGRYLMGDILNQIPDCDAVFCNNDDLALGAAFECQRRNISIPQQMGICGFNDLGIVSEMYPSVTSVYTPRFKIGKQAVEMAIRAGKEELANAERIVELHAELRVRSSTSPKR